MSKLPQDPSKFGYRSDAKVTITGQEFMILQHLAQKAIGNGITESFIQTQEWINLKTGEPVAKPSKKQLMEGSVTKVASRAKTLENKQISYNANLYPEIFDGNEVIFAIHLRNIESNVATPSEVLEKEYRERQLAEQNKGAMKVVEDAPEEKVVSEEKTEKVEE